MAKNANETPALFSCECEAQAHEPAPPQIAPLKPTAVYDTYWRFAAERQRIFFRRQVRPVGPWTDDPVLRATSSRTRTGRPTASAST